MLRETRSLALPTETAPPCFQLGSALSGRHGIDGEHGNPQPVAPSSSPTENQNLIPVEKLSLYCSFFSFSESYLFISSRA